MPSSMYVLCQFSKSITTVQCYRALSPPGWPLPQSHTSSTRYVVCQYSKSITTVQRYSAVTAGLAVATLTHAFLQVCCMPVFQENHHCPALQRRHRQAGRRNHHTRFPPGMLYTNTKSGITAPRWVSRRNSHTHLPPGMLYANNPRASPESRLAAP